MVVHTDQLLSHSELTIKWVKVCVAVVEKGVKCISSNNSAVTLLHGGCVGRFPLDCSQLKMPFEDCISHQFTQHILTLPNQNCLCWLKGANPRHFSPAAPRAYHSSIIKACKSHVLLTAAWQGFRRSSHFVYIQWDLDSVGEAGSWTLGSPFLSYLILSSFCVC